MLRGVELLELIEVDLGLVRSRIRDAMAGCPSVIAAYVYGSVLGRARQDSDIDVGLVLDAQARDDPQTLDLEVALELRLGTIEGHSFDVRVFRTASPLFVLPAIRSGELVFSRDEDALTTFLERVSSAYREDAPRHRRAVREVLQ